MHHATKAGKLSFVYAVYFSLAVCLTVDPFKLGVTIFVKP